MTWSAPYIGIPYADRGRDPAIGLDCWGLVRHVLHDEMQADLPSYDIYSSSDEITETAAIVEENRNNPAQWFEVTLDIAKSFDVILFAIKGHPCHVGVVARRPFMLHTLRPHHSCLEKFTSPKWVNRVRGVFRLGSVDPI